MPLHTGENGRHKQINKQQVLERMWRKGNPRSLLLVMKTVVATLENSMEFPQKTKNGTAFDPAIRLLGLYTFTTLVQHSTRSSSHSNKKN